MHPQILTVACWLLLVITIPANSSTEMASAHHKLFSEEIIDARGVQRSWGKAVGDINGDG